MYRVADNKQPQWLVLLARLVSFVFHPLFICCYVMAFLIFVHPAAFTGFDHRTRVQRLLTVVFNDTFYPGFAVFILWRLHLFTDSIHLRTSKERIIPYLIAMICYFWTWNVFKHLSDSPPIAVKFLLGSFLAVCGAWFCNIYCKISMHTIAVGSVLAFFILFSFQDAYASGSYLAVVFLVTGAVCTARFLASDHSPFEIYLGLFVGMLAQVVAWQF
jgi:hypothetical protein